MAKAFIGLDITDSSWKSVVISMAAKDKLRVHGFFSMPPVPLPLARMIEDLDQGPEIENQIAQWALEVNESLGELAKQSSGVIVGLPQNLVSLRVLDLPFSQKSRIAQTLPFEAESTLPFDIEDLIFDYFNLRSAEGEARVFTAAAQKTDLNSLLERLGMMQIDPAVVSPTAASFHHLVGLMVEPEEALASRLLFVHLTSHHVQIAAVQGKRTIFATAINLGLQPLPPEPVIAAEGEPAEQQREARPEPTPEELRQHRELLIPLLFTTLERTIHFLEGYDPFEEGCPPPVKRIVLLGQGGFLADLEPLITERTGLETRRFRIHPGVLSEDTEIQEHLHSEIGPSLALALERAMPNGKPVLNFRKDEFAYRPERRALIRKMIMPAVLMAVLLIVLGYGAFAQSGGEKGRVDALRKDINRIFKSNFSAISTGDPLKQADKMLQEAKTKLSKYQDLTYPKAIDCLAAASDVIPDPPRVLIQRFEFQGAKFTISGTTQSIDNANEIARRLKDVPIFAKVDQGKITQKDEEVSFSISVDLKEQAP